MSDFVMKHYERNLSQVIGEIEIELGDDGVAGAVPFRLGMKGPMNLRGRKESKPYNVSKGSGLDDFNVD